MQSSTDDLSHDEALSNRVAALNLLDLGLQHLGIEIDEAINEEELNLVVNACGESQCVFFLLVTLICISNVVQRPSKSVSRFGRLSKPGRQGGNPCCSS